VRFRAWLGRFAGAAPLDPDWNPSRRLAASDSRFECAACSESNVSGSAACSAASLASRAASSFAKQHFLNFLPEPQGHESFRPVVIAAH
jgi:hypothetical protein